MYVAIREAANKVVKAALQVFIYFYRSDGELIISRLSSYSIACKLSPTANLVFH